MNGELKELRDKVDELRKSKDIVKEQLEDIEKQIKEIENQEHTKMCQAMFENREVLLKLVRHDRTSCSDDKIDNVGRCIRCTLLDAKDVQDLTEYHWDFQGIIFGKRGF